MEIDRDNFEYALSQYADGTLNELDRRIVDERLATDAEARLLLSDYQHVDQLLRDGRELPEIDFDAFAARISGSIANEESHVAGPLRMPMRWFVPAAAAAVLAICAVVAFRPAPSTPAVATGTSIITAPHIETADATPTITIGVGPSDALAKRGDRLSLGEEAIAPPSPKVVISAAGAPGKDDVRPY